MKISMGSSVEAFFKSLLNGILLRTNLVLNGSRLTNTIDVPCLLNDG